MKAWKQQQDDLAQRRIELENAKKTGDKTPEKTLHGWKNSASGMQSGRPVEPMPATVPTRTARTPRRPRPPPRDVASKPSRRWS